MAAEKTYKFLDDQGVISLAEEILKSVNTRITERIVQTVDDESDENHVPSAAAVYSAISAVKATKLIVHTGNINEVQIPEKNAIYLQRDDEEDITWTMYVYASVSKTTTSEDDAPSPKVEYEDKWISIGTTDLTLDNYWSKDDIEDLKSELGITDIAEQIEDKVSAEQMVAYTPEEIQGFVSSAFENTKTLDVE